MTTTPEILSLAVRTGLAGVGDVVSGVVDVVPVPRTNAVHRVQRHGRPIAYAKQPGMASRLDGDDVVAAERLALTRLHPLGLTPPLIPQGGPAVVWTGVAAGRDLLAMSFGGTSPARVAGSLGQALARLHTAPVDAHVPVSRPPWPLLAEPLPSMRTLAADRSRDAVLAVWREHRVQRLLQPLAERWRDSSHWTHGDLSATNVFVGDDASVTFIDLESAGRGDPAWDVVSLEEALTATGIPPAGFRAAYAAAGGPAVQPSPGWRLVRALVTAWQHGAQPDSDNRALVEQLLSDARRNALGTQEDAR